MMNAEFVTALSTAIAALFTAVAAGAAVAAVVVANRQLRNLNETLRLNNEALRLNNQTLRMNSLGFVLQIEVEMNARKAKVNDLATQLLFAKGKSHGNHQEIDILSGAMNAALENWFNMAERFAFCINKKYLDEDEWKTEYRGYFAELIKNHPEFFTESSIYTHIKDLNHRWQRS